MWGRFVEWWIRWRDASDAALVQAERRRRFNEERMTTPLPPPNLREVQRFTRDSMPLGSWHSYRKKVHTEMVRINGPFVVETQEGPLLCQDGWLARDSRGWPYPIADEEQQAIYERA